MSAINHFVISGQPAHAMAGKVVERLALRLASSVSRSGGDGGLSPAPTLTKSEGDRRILKRHHLDSHSCGVGLSVLAARSASLLYRGAR